MTTTTSNHGSPRQRRREKAARDLQTQHALWIQRIRDHVAAGSTAHQALAKLEGEMPAWIAEIPARQAQRRDAWNEFVRHIRSISKAP